MTLPQEVILCAAGPSGSGSGMGGIFLHDIQTGVTLASFKQTSADVNCTSIVQTQQGQGGIMLAAQPDKPLVNVYSFQKDQIMLRIAVPEKLSCFAIDRVGSFCAAGTAQGRIYLWEVASGILFSSFEAHYRRVTVLRFSDDGAALASASEDSSVTVWAMSSLLDNDTQNTLPTPYWILSDHTLAVTDLQFGMGVFPNCRLFTCSLDQTCKLWDIATQILLTTFIFPRPLSVLVVERSERTFFVGSADGHIHQMNLFRHKKSSVHRNALEAIGGGGSSDAIRMAEDDENEKLRLIVTGQPLKSLAISITSSLLLAGTSEGSILIYDIPSHQLLRSIQAHKGFSINMVTTMLKPPDLIGHVSLGFGSDRETIPVRPITGFQRIRDAKAREKHEVPIMLLDLDEPQAPKPSIMDHVLKYHDVFVADAPGASADGSVTSLQTRVTDLEAEVAHLRGQLGKAKGINDAMWETVVNTVLSSGSQPNGSEDGEGPSRKRQRTDVTK